MRFFKLLSCVEHLFFPAILFLRKQAPPRRGFSCIPEHFHRGQSGGMGRGSGHSGSGRPQQGQSFGARHGGLLHMGCGGLEPGDCPHPPPHEHGGRMGREQF